MIGYFFKPETWGRGIATDAVRVLTAYLFTKRRYERRLSIGTTHATTSRSAGACARSGARYVASERSAASVSWGSGRTV